MIFLEEIITIEPNIVDPIMALLNKLGGVFSLIAGELSSISIWSIIVRIILALSMSGCIGMERAARKHAAGLRTYILVCLGATLIMLTDQFLRETYNTGDGSRLGAAVITGVGFLGAGTILFTSRGQIKGLTTAAGLWAIACIGLCLGCGFYTASIVGFLFVVLAVLFLSKIEKAFTNRRGCFEIHVEFETRLNLKEFVKYIRTKEISIASVEHNTAYSQSGLSVYTIVLVTKNKKQKMNHLSLINEISQLPYVEYVEEI
ncbi:MAG: MgtC/SapB family protein [Bacillales bacterium]|nr:MgtC/SapB family protein [Bacillales bacterium]